MIDDLRAQVEIELEGMTVVVNELAALQHDLAGREPTVREKTAAAAFLAQFYGGIENVLKRICYYHNIPVPSGNNWHVELFQRFCLPLLPGYPTLFGESLASKLAPYRRFRHVALHTYGFQIDWGRMETGISELSDVFIEVKEAILKYLQFAETGKESY